MKLKKGCRDEYKARHAALWPEVRRILKDSGVYDYSIYLDEETDTWTRRRTRCSRSRRSLATRGARTWEASRL